MGSRDAGRVKAFYLKYLLPFEKRNYFGAEGEEELPALLLSAGRRGGKESPAKAKEEAGSLVGEIGRTLEEEEQRGRQFFLRKSRLGVSKAETKRVMVGLDALMPRRDVVYSLNTLMLYSVNNHHPFLFENHEKIFAALASYTHSIYPARHPQDLEDLRTITLILRNLTMNPINLKFMLGTSVFALLVNMFNTGFDPECSKNIVDIMNGLVKVGWDCAQILREINAAILEDRLEDVEGSVELLRGLIDEREETLAPAVTQNVKALLRVLMSVEVSMEIKEQIFEILAFVTDISSQSREELLRNDTLLYIIIGILQHMKNQEKLIQFVALTLSNLSSASTAKLHLKKFEAELMMIGFSDDSLAGIISNILTELSH